MIFVKNTKRDYPNEKSKTKVPYAVYRCPRCEVEREIVKYNAEANKSGLCKSCMLIERNTKHGMKNHKLYKTWKGERNRCLNPRNSAYKNYGGRGIKFSPEFDSFEYWVKYVESLDNAYKEGYTLDRIDNDGNYEKGNLKWSSKSEQCLNRRLLKNNSTGERNIALLKDGKYLVQVQLNGKQKKLGRFKTLEEAINVRNNFYSK